MVYVAEIRLDGKPVQLALAHTLVQSSRSELVIDNLGSTFRHVNLANSWRHCFVEPLRSLGLSQILFHVHHNQSTAALQHLKHLYDQVLRLAYFSPVYLFLFLVLVRKIAFNDLPGTELGSYIFASSTSLGCRICGPAR
jgi:hypothetical protein